MAVVMLPCLGSMLKDVLDDIFFLYPSLLFASVAYFSPRLPFIHEFRSRFR